MKFEFYVSSAVVTAFATVISSVISSWIAKRAAESAANKEIEKMKLGWEREDIVSSDEEFAEMAKAVAKVIDYNTFANRQDAIGKVAAIRSKEYGELGEILDQLYAAVKAENDKSANVQLSMAIDKKRSLKLSARSENCQV